MRTGLCCLVISGLLFTALAAAQKKGPPKKKAVAEKKSTSKKKPVVKKKPSPFHANYKDFKDTIVRLNQIQKDYKSVEPSGRKALEEKFKAEKSHADALLPKLQSLAESAIVIEPTNTDVIDFLTAMADEAKESSDPEEALRLSKLVLDHEVKARGKDGVLWRPVLYRIGGMAAFDLMGTTASKNQPDYAEIAENYLKKLEERALLDLKENTFRFLDTESSKEYRQQLPDERKYWTKEQELRRAEAKANDLPRVRLKTTKGDLILELFENDAPNTVANFISLVQPGKKTPSKKTASKKTASKKTPGFYDGTPFHRVTLTGIECGKDKENTLDYSIGCEFQLVEETKKNKTEGEAEGKKEKEKEQKKIAKFRRHFRGSLSMVLKGAKNDSSCSEFVISLKPRWKIDLLVDEDGNAMNGRTIVFGRVVEGFDVLTKLSKNNDPDSPDRIETAELIRPAKRPHTLKKISDKTTEPKENDEKTGEKGKVGE